MSHYHPVKPISHHIDCSFLSDLHRLVFVPIPILQEILQGVRKPQDFIRLKEYFDPFPLIEIEREDYIRAAELKNNLSRNGIQVSTIDALIATASIVNDCYLHTNDKDFSHIARHSKLKL